MTPDLEKELSELSEAALDAIATAFAKAAWPYNWTKQRLDPSDEYARANENIRQLDLTAARTGIKAILRNGSLVPAGGGEPVFVVIPYGDGEGAYVVNGYDRAARTAFSCLVCGDPDDDDVNEADRAIYDAIHNPASVEWQEATGNKLIWSFEDGALEVVRIWSPSQSSDANLVPAGEGEAAEPCFVIITDDSVTKLACGYEQAALTALGCVVDDAPDSPRLYESDRAIYDAVRNPESPEWKEASGTNHLLWSFEDGWLKVVRVTPPSNLVPAGREKELEGEVARLREAAQIAEERFRFYEQSHLAKGTQDGDEKAYRNKQLADKMSAALSNGNPEVVPRGISKARKAHWFRLPKHLRDRIWATYRPGQEITKTPSRAYLDAAKAIEDWIRENE